MNAVITPISQKIQLPWGLEYVFQRISSLLQKPASGGIPAIASVAMPMVRNVHGIYDLSPPIFRMSCSPPTAWITDPAARKRRPLKNACVIKWKIPAENAPTPQAMNMYPSCETVEYASTFLISVCVTPMVAANNAVRVPTIATTVNAIGARSNITCDRETIYTPAVTIVAA